MAGMGKHGMLVVGLDSIWASHLPMFHPPHDFQMLMEVGLEDAEAYRKDRRASGEPLYTLDPEKMSWKDLLPDGSKPPTRTSFTADIYRGHFERGGTQILEKAKVEVRRVAYSSPLVAADPPASDLTYRVVGGGDQLFLAHEIHGAPSFDHVVSFRFEDPAGVVSAIGDPVVIRGRADSADDRVKPGESVRGVFLQTIGPDGQHGFSTQLAVLEEAYLEIGELKD